MLLQKYFIPMLQENIKQHLLVWSVLSDMPLKLHGIEHNVGAKLKGAAVDGSGKRVVDNQGHTVGMGNAGKLLNVEHHYARIGERLAENQFRIGAEGRADFLLACVLVHKSHLNAQLAQGGAKQIVRSAVNAVGATLQ